jgi:hypothetical protein
MNKIFALLVFMVGLAGCEFYTYETQMIPPKRPHFTIDSYYGPECHNADYEYSVSFRTYVCEWRCASYGGYHRTGLELRFEEYYNDWLVREFLSSHDCY